MSRPATMEGWQIWDLVLRLGGQLRAIPGAVLGWDLTAALALASALGIDARLVAEVLPEIEPIVVAKINEQVKVSADG
jgi:hypothetical protein